MFSPRTAHLMALCLWGGVVLAEAVIELLPRRNPLHRNSAVVFHLWIDLLIEIPVIVLVLLTGTWLLQGRPWDARLAWKAGTGLAAVAANLVCVLLVMWRAWARDRSRGPRRILSLSRAILVSAAVGLPFAVLSGVLGLTR